MFLILFIRTVFNTCLQNLVFPGIDFYLAKKSLKEFNVIFVIFTFGQIIVLNKYCTYNKPIPKISHFKTLQNL